MIYQDGEHSALRTIAKNVPKEMFGTEGLSKIITEMYEALDRENDGVAIAAPQIGVPLSIFVVSKKIDKFKKEKNFVFINPKITTVSQEKKLLEEGCLSVRWLYGKVFRHEKVTIKAKNTEGVLFEKKAEGLLAHIFQHETDHLLGTLFIDKAHDLFKLTDEEIKKMENNENY
jgi:peptide deformylase